jgi:hypothetical protein
VLPVELADPASIDDLCSPTSEVPSLQDEPMLPGPLQPEHLPVASSSLVGASPPALGVSALPPASPVGDSVVPATPQLALLLFSGSSTRTDGTLQSHLEVLGFTVEAYDLLNGAAGDLSDDAVWDPLLRRIQSGIFTVAVIAAPFRVSGMSPEFLGP